jgi:hypothetical protein
MMFCTILFLLAVRHIRAQQKEIVLKALNLAERVVSLRFQVLACTSPLRDR